MQRGVQVHQRWGSRKKARISASTSRSQLIIPKTEKTGTSNTVCFVEIQR